MLGNIIVFTLFICWCNDIGAIGRSSTRNWREYIGLPKPGEARAYDESIKLFLDAYMASYGEDLQCGDWQDSYKKLHSSILANKSPQKYLISVAPKQGLADRITALVSHFILALLTNRALLLATPDGLPPFTTAYKMKSIRSIMPSDFVDP